MKTLLIGIALAATRLTQFGLLCSMVCLRLTSAGPPLTLPPSIELDGLFGAR